MLRVEKRDPFRSSCGEVCGFAQPVLNIQMFVKSVFIHANISEPFNSGLCAV